MTDMDMATIASDEPELPPLPPPSRRAAPILTRKRTIDQVLYSASSDPPLFSSDDASSTVENYAAPRAKKLHRGTWWSSQEQAVVVPGKRAFTRNFDSGIWMGSDSSYSDIDHLLECEERQVTQEHAPNQQNKTISVMELANAGPALSPAQRRALSIVEQCVLDNNPIIDLSSMDLSELPWEVLKPLATFVREPKTQFEPLYLNVEIYLAHNKLTSVPEELFTIPGIRLISLRNNKLSEIPPSVGKLTGSLDKLNLSMNRLRYLPSEIGELHYSTWRVAGNPFFTKVYPIDISDPSSDSFGHSSTSLSSFSRVAFLGTQGQAISGSVPSRDFYAKGLPNTEHTVIPRAKSKVASLYSMAIRASTTYPIEQLLLSLGKDVPDSMIENLKNAAGQAKAGWPRCAICRREYTIARTEWLEWQTVDNRLSVPLLYRGCSWNCSPYKYDDGKMLTYSGWTQGPEAREKSPPGSFEEQELQN